MALDHTDKQLVNGLIMAAVAVALAYYSPWYGYQEDSRLEEEARTTLKQTAVKWIEHFPRMHAAAYGEYSLDTPESPEGAAYVSELNTAYAAANEQTQKELLAKEATSRMNFPAWTEIPADQQEPGMVFASTQYKHKLLLEDEWRRERVECLDPEIGFSKWTGDVGNLNHDKSEEYLRELHITEMIIRLCIQAKHDEEAYETSRGFASEAFMRIRSVAPSESVATAPTALLPNLSYDPLEKNPLSPKFRRYKVLSWRKFIQEYPVEIVLQCDINTFMRFLHKVRTPGEFLVIRNLEILSPFLDDSRVDKTELRRFRPTDAAVAAKEWPPKDEHILVTMSASGMDFFDPVKFPNGIYNPVKREAPQFRPGRRRLAPTKTTTE